jgi:hypothetical protein
MQEQLKSGKSALFINFSQIVSRKIQMVVQSAQIFPITVVELLKEYKMALIT